MPEPLPTPHAQPVAAVLAALGADAHQGLSEAVAGRRLLEIGPNSLREAPRPGLLHSFMAQFQDFVVLLLIGAAIIAGVVDSIKGEGFTESLAIVAIVLLNALMGVIQERRAERALRALQAMAAPDATVVRDGRRMAVPDQDVVPGDLVVLEAGNFVPADLRLTEAANLQIEEAALTGESLPVRKEAGAELAAGADLGDRVTMAYRGTVVTYGRGTGVATATGMATEIGQIAELIQSYEQEPTPLQQRLDALGKQLGVITLVICAIVFVEELARETPFTGLLRAPVAYATQYGEHVLDVFMTAVSLAIAAVPEGLPAVVTIALAIGMQRMVRRHALVRRLPAVETLGSATVICSDKTGTLTQNEMMVVQVELAGRTLTVVGKGHLPAGEVYEDGALIDVQPGLDADLDLLAMGATLASDAVVERDGDAWHVVGDPTEGALVTFARRVKLSRTRILQALPRVAELPFESQRKRMTTLHRVRSEGGLSLPNVRTGQVIAFVKGAPDGVLARSTRYRAHGRTLSLDEEAGRRIEIANQAMAAGALRVLGLAYRVFDDLPGAAELTPDFVERDLVFVGLLGMIDPPRPEAAAAIARARGAGVRTVMITGDYRDTAAAIARQVGLLGAVDAPLAVPDSDGRASARDIHNRSSARDIVDHASAGDIHDRSSARNLVDHPPAGNPDLASFVLTGADLDAMDEATLVRRALDVVVYARVSPEHKVRIVEALKQSGAIVAMTGDGVNDAPALQRAHIGVAMGRSGTDVSREAADMVLTDDNYASIVAAIEEGRTIYTNIRKFVYYLVSCNIAEILIIFLAVLFGYPAPLLPIHLLWLNFVTDGLPALALGLEQAEPDVMDRPPRPAGEEILSRDLWPLIAVQSAVDTVATLGAFIWAYGGSPDNLRYAQTIAFVTLVTAELLRAYTSRSQRELLAVIGPFSNRWMVLATASSFALLLLAVYAPGLASAFRTQPLTLAQWLPVLGFAMLPALASEVIKVWMQFRGRGRGRTPVPGWSAP